MKSSEEKTNVWEGMGNDWMSKKYQTGQMKCYAPHNLCRTYCHEIPQEPSVKTIEKTRCLYG